MPLPEFHLAPITVWYLSMSERPHSRLTLPPGIEPIAMSHPVSTADYLQLYRSVGDAWHWIDRVVMPDDELHAKINLPLEAFSFVEEPHNAEKDIKSYVVQAHKVLNELQPNDPSLKLVVQMLKDK